MENRGNQEVDLAEQYRAMLRAYYQRLNAERMGDKKVGAIEEVKLRLFLSLLDKPRNTDWECQGLTGSPS